MASTAGGHPARVRDRHTCPDGVTCAQITWGGAQVALSFHGDLTPVEAVAAFLRDVADVSDQQALRDLADQLDPIDTTTVPPDDREGAPT